MSFLERVSSFEQVIPHITKHNAVVLCDIDDTALKENVIPRHLTRFKHIKNYPVCPTDYMGFIRMHFHLLSPSIQGKIEFLTARHESSDDITRMDLQQLRLHVPSETLVIHYTNNRVTKGEYIRRFLQHYLRDNRQIIFIDDNVNQILSVQKECPEIKCFLYTKI